MGLQESSIRTWDDMKKTFLKKYKEYCKTRDDRNDIFNMVQQEYESLEYFVERFQYNLSKTQHDLNNDSAKTIFLKAIRDECIDALNLMGSGDISQMSYVEICELSRKYSRSHARSGKGPQDVFSSVTKSTNSGVTRVELGSLLEDFKISILGTLSTQFDTLKAKKKQEDENAISIFRSKCIQKYPLRYFL